MTVMDLAGYKYKSIPDKKRSVKDRKLTEEILYELGFMGEGKDVIDNPAYRLKIPGYFYKIQVVLMDLPDDNPNSGIVSLYSRERKDEHCYTWVEKKPGKKKPGKKKYKNIDHIQSEDKDGVHGIQYITIPEKCIPIAYHVTTIERLRDIIYSLTGVDVTIRPKSKK